MEIPDLSGVKKSNNQDFVSQNQVSVDIFFVTLNSIYESLIYVGDMCLM